MTLLLRQNCPHASAVMSAVEKLDARTQISVFEVISHPDGTPYIEIKQGEFIPLPPEIRGLPALIVDTHIYMGAQPILERLKETA